MPAPGLADPRTGYRSAQDLVYTPSSPQARSLCGADGRTVGISYASLRWIMEQNVDIPVPHDGGGRVGDRSLQGFPGQSSTASLGADFPAATAEQNVVIPVPRGDRTLHSALSSSVLPMTAIQGVFSTFPRGKKSARSGSHSGSELLPESSPSTLSAHQMATDERTSMVDANGHAWVRLDTARGSYWQNLDTGHHQWRPPSDPVH